MPVEILIGKSASGKDSILRKWLRNHGKPVISYTTRPMRPKEHDGVDYHFVTKEKFMELVKTGAVFEYREYSTLVNNKQETWYYGTPVIPDINRENYLSVVDIDGAYAYIKQYGADNIQIFYIHSSDKIRKQRSMKRGGFDETEWNRRCKDDNIRFSDETLQKLANALGKPVIKLTNNDRLDNMIISLIQPDKLTNNQLGFGFSNTKPCENKKRFETIDEAVNAYLELHSDCKDTLSDALCARLADDFEYISNDTNDISEFNTRLAEAVENAFKTQNATSKVK